RGVCLGSCVRSNASPHGGCVTVREMKEGPSGSAIRSLIPSHCKLLSSKSDGGERCRKVGTMIPAGKVERGERKQTASEASKAEAARRSKPIPARRGRG